MGIFGLSYYGQTQTPIGPAGARSRTAGYDSRRSAINPSLPMNFTAAIGGTADDGEYSITVKDDVTGENYTTKFERADSETNAEIATELGANWNSQSKANDLFTASVVDDDITFSGKIAGRTFTVTKSAPGTGTITIATSQAAGGTKLPPGIFVARSKVGSADGYTPDEVRLLKTGDAIGAVYGFLERLQILGEIRDDGDTVTADETYKPGDIVPPMRQGSFWMDCETDFNALTDTPYLRVVAGAGEQAGVIRKNNDGGDAIDASSILKVIQGTSAAGRVEVHIDIKP